MERSPFEALDPAEKEEFDRRRNPFERLRKKREEQEHQTRQEKEAPEQPERDQAEQPKRRLFERIKKKQHEQADEQPERAEQQTPESEQVRRQLAKEYIAYRREQVALEVEDAKPGTPEHLAALADLDLLEAVDHKLEHPELEFEESVEEAYSEVMSAVDAVIAEISQEERELDEETELQNEIDEPEEPNARQPQPQAKPAKPRGKTVKVEPKQTPRVTAKPPAAQHFESSPTDYSTTPSAEPGLPLPSMTEVSVTVPDRHEAPSLQESMAAKPPERAIVARRVGSLLARPNAPSPRTPEGGPSHFGGQQSPRQVETPSLFIASKESHVRERVAETVLEPLERPAYTRVEVHTPHAQKYERHANPENTPSAPMALVHEKSAHHPAESPSRKIEQLSTPDLLTVAGNINVEGTTARKLYESNQIDRNGLISIVKAALKGGDVRRAASKARLGEEAQRGRHIEMRHDDPVVSVQGQGASATQRPPHVVEQLISELNHPTGPNVSTLQPQQTQVTDPRKLSAAAAQKALEKRAKSATIGVVVAIGVSAAAIVALLYFV